MWKVSKLYFSSNLNWKYVLILLVTPLLNLLLAPSFPVVWSSKISVTNYKLLLYHFYRVVINTQENQKWSTLLQIAEVSIIRTVGSFTWLLYDKKKLKLLWQKLPKIVAKKQNFDQKINSSKYHVWSLSINFRFSRRKSESQKTSTKRHSFYITVLLKKPHPFYSTHQILWKMYSRNIAKNLTHFADFIS